ncbi:hypothetical protein ACEQPO_01465 [Bacillus sp. SL00103]
MQVSGTTLQWIFGLFTRYISSAPGKAPEMTEVTKIIGRRIDKSIEVMPFSPSSPSFYINGLHLKWMNN